MQIPRFAIQPEPVPIEDSVGSVGVLLYFKDNHAGAQGVNPAAGQEHNISGPNAHPVKAIRDRAVTDPLAELLFGAAAPQANVKLGIWNRFSNIPHFGLG